MTDRDHEDIDNQTLRDLFADMWGDSVGRAVMVVWALVFVLGGLTLALAWTR